MTFTDALAVFKSRLQGNPAVKPRTKGYYEYRIAAVHNMHGNVAEWCHDWYWTYPGTATDPVGPATGSDRVFREGSWFYYGTSCRSAYRLNDTPTGRNYAFGFRVVLARDQKTLPATFDLL